MAGRGDQFGERTDGLTLQHLIESPNGIDLGEIRERRAAQVVKHEGGVIALAPALMLEEINRLAATPASHELLLIGRRSTRSNNTWLRNLTSLNSGSSLCDLYVHPMDAQHYGVADGETVQLTGPKGQIEATAKITGDIASGVVCLPHGFSEDTSIAQSNLATGPNYNRLVGAFATDKPSGTAALNGVPVTLTKVA